MKEARREGLKELLYADDTVLLAESERMLQRIVDEFDRVCRRKLGTILCKHGSMEGDIRESAVKGEVPMRGRGVGGINR